MTTKPNEPEGLEPCPFCGGEAELTGYRAPEFWVRCPAIGCKATTEGFGSKDRAIAAWNRRAAVQPVADAGGVTEEDRELAIGMALWLYGPCDYSSALKDKIGSGEQDNDMHIQAIRQFRLQSVAAATAAKDVRVKRALGLYPEWCRNWGMDQNMRVASEAASECAAMIDYLPDELPEDDEAAALAIHKALSEAREAGE